MRDNFIFISPKAGRGNVTDIYYETFPELPQQQEKYEYLYEGIYGADWEDRFDPDDLNTLCFSARNSETI